MKRIGFVMWMVLLAVPAAGQGIDTGAPMLCAVTEAIECGYDASCTYGPADDLNIPPFLVIDAKARTLREHRGERKSSVEAVTERDGQLLLRGFEQRAFQISISQETGRLTASAVSPDAGFVLFGICTNQ